MIAAGLASAALAPAAALAGKTITLQPAQAAAGTPAAAPASAPAAANSAAAADAKASAGASAGSAANALTPEAVNAATLPATADAKASTAAVVRVQVLLDRAHFSPGEIDGAMGSNVKRAITGFQRKHGLKETGMLDAETFAKLTADKTPALTTYTIAQADVAGPFTSIPEDMAEKAKLEALGYTSALEALGEKFHASPKLLQRLNPGKDLTRAGEQIVVPNVEGSEPLPKAGKIVIDKTDRTLTLLDTAGKVIAQYPSSSGTENDPLPIGTWKVNGISKNPVFHYNPKLFWDAEPGDKKAKIPPGPNNPVGVAWIDLSKPHYGIHGTPVPASIGKTQSHGCIRLTNWDVTAVTTSVSAGTEVVMQE
ncbi:L,D-transpeptidase [Massilia sp. PAMC28688]|nr:L,D-transpeptidase [Massilia sp. PAMC28688]